MVVVQYDTRRHFDRLCDFGIVEPQVQGIGPGIDTGPVRDGYQDWDLDDWSPDRTLLCQSRQMLAVLD